MDAAVSFGAIFCKMALSFVDIAMISVFPFKPLLFQELPFWSGLARRLKILLEVSLLFDSAVAELIICAFYWERVGTGCSKFLS